MNYPKVVNELDTIDFILNNKVSIARYGDGELKLCNGKAAKSQEPDPFICQKLREILVEKNDRCIVGIPNIATRELPDEKRRFWTQYLQPKYTQFYDFGRKYFSSFITRPDSAPSIGDAAYWNKVKSLWAGRHVVLIQGVDTNFDKTNTFFDTSVSKTVLRGPARDAYREHSDIIKKVVKTIPTDFLIVLALGPTATVMAWDLSLLGYQALDLGHIGMFHAKTHWKTPK